MHRSAGRSSAGPQIRVESRRLGSQVAHELICEILRGAYAEGETLPSEEMLSEHFGVSRPVVREAMQVLVSLSMVRTRQGQGSVLLREEQWNELAPELLVARCETGTAEEVLAQVIELRSVLEARAAELAARRAGPKDLERLQALLLAMRAAGDDREAFLRYDMEFHRDILLLAGNLLVVKLFDLLEPMLHSARRLALERQEHPEGMLRGIDEHVQILDALAKGSPKAARAALEGHLTWVQQRVDVFEAALDPPR
ncbi:MAG TPA: FadR/GntR family transcriptional regulator [Acidimicrobiales bacterium]|nr:FadR/GntR family transcriptional regulator [Acidimicrobiales bacterium]